MAGSSKNLGQVAGLYIGTSAPTNKVLIWYDTSSNVHKTFDVGLNAWTVLQPQTITSITYSALVSRASGQGLTQGQWFKITDRSNALALAITATKVQYVNNNGVPVVDDLGTHVMYNVTSENLIIDDVTGVYDATTNKLTFSFSETTPVMNTGNSDVDYVLGEQKRGNTKTLRKFRLSSLLSAVTGNDISWDGGFFFNFYNKLKSYFDTTGGVASHDALEEYKVLNNQAIEDMTQTAQDAIQTVGQNINQATDPTQIYGKQLPIAPTNGVTVDIAQGDTLSGIVVKIYRWINKFKKADGIAMPANYTSASNATPVNNNDNVSTAIGKLSKYATLHNTGDGIQVSNSAFVPASEDPGAIVNTDSLLTAIKKLYWSTQKATVYTFANTPTTSSTYAYLANCGGAWIFVFRIRTVSEYTGKSIFTGIVENLPAEIIQKLTTGIFSFPVMILPGTNNTSFVAPALGLVTLMNSTDGHLIFQVHSSETITLATNDFTCLEFIIPKF